MRKHSQFTCIYCRQSSPHVTAANAHIVPHVLGGRTWTGDAVCHDCNQKVNSEVEGPAFALTLFKLFQSYFGIRGRRGDIRKVPATVTIDGIQGYVLLNERGQPTDATILSQTDDSGKKRLRVCGPEELVDKKTHALRKRRSDLKWTDEPGERSVLAVIDYGPDVTSTFIRRLATKIALERFAMLRSAAFVATAEFDNARGFILTGTEREPCCGILSNEFLLTGALNFPVPCHAVMVVSHPQDSVLGAIVAFYGLFYYWVALSWRYTALGSMDDVMLAHPQTRRTEVPPLRRNLGRRMPWPQIIEPYRRDPVAVASAAMVHAQTKLQTTLVACAGHRCGVGEGE